jgi:hypothetical protein
MMLFKSSYSSRLGDGTQKGKTPNRKELSGENLFRLKTFVASANLLLLTMQRASSASKKKQLKMYLKECSTIYVRRVNLLFSSPARFASSSSPRLFSIQLKSRWKCLPSSPWSHEHICYARSDVKTREEARTRRGERKQPSELNQIE